MAFGSILSGASSFYVSTSDGITKRIDNNLFVSIVLRFLGIPHLGLRLRASTILKFLDPQKDDIILDAGCGIGLYLLTISKMINQGYGIDNNSEKIEEAKKIVKNLCIDNIILKNARLVHLDAYQLFFDKIICSEVLDYIEDDDKLLKNFFHMLKNGGTLIISARAASKFNKGQKQEPDHKRIGYSLGELRSMLIGNGFSVEEVLPYGFFYGQIAWRINRIFFSNNFLNALFFYPLILIAYLDKFLPRHCENNCMGYIIKSRKQ